MLKKTGKKYLLWFLLFFLSFSFLFYFATPYLLRHYLHYYLEQYQIQSSSLQISRNFTLSIQNLQFTTSNFRIFIDSLSLKPDFYRSIQTLEPTIHTISIQNILIKKTKKPFKNISKSPIKDKHDTLKTTSLLSFSQKAYKNIKKILTHLPQKINIKQCTFYNDSLQIGRLSNFHQRQTNYSGLLEIQGNSAHIQGNINPALQKITLSIFPTNQPMKLTLSNPNLSIGFQEFHGTIQIDTILTVRSQWEKFSFFHPKVAEKPVSMDSFYTSLRLKVTGRELSLYPGSIIQVNQWKIRPLLSLYQAQDTILSCNLFTDTIDAQEGFQSIPSALRERLGPMRFTGKWAFHAHLYIHLGKKDSASISVKPHLHRFRILSYGNTPIPMLNDTFSFKPYRAKRSIHVGPLNPYFIPLDQISPYLIHAVRVSEDGSFFRHRGFNVKAIQESLIENLRRGYFARGGSTISMQLIKNVFLTHKKTLARKLQEIFLTWLMEYFQLVPKERILEVYLNIIEWGPDIYGIGEASEFYFKRKPLTLTPSEAIFLSMIIPSPRKFYYFFNTDNDSLKKSVEYHYKLVGYFLKRDSIITETQYQRLFPPYVFIIGEARKYLPSVRKYLNSLSN